MKCPKCRNNVPDNVSFCTYCGCKLEPFIRASEEPHYTQRNPQKRSNVLLYVLLGVVVLLLVGTTVLMLTGGIDSLFHKGSGRNDLAAVTASPETAAVTAAPTAAPIPTPSPTPTNTPEPDYLLPDSSSRYLTESDLSVLSHRELCLARNEIFARHGRMFDTPEIRAYFESKSWYRGTIAPSQFRDSVLSEIEKANIEYIVNYENKHFGGSYY